MGSFIYETVYDAASTIDYSKDPIDAGVVDSPPAKKVFRHSPSPSPLKGLQRTCVRSRPVGAGAPQRRLRMDARPTSSGQTRDPLRGAMPVQANSDASVPRTKVPYISTLLSYNEGLVKLFRSSSLNLNPSYSLVGMQVASTPKPPRSDASTELERYNSLRRSQRHSTSSYSNSSSYHSGGRHTPNTMSDYQPRNGYSRAAEIFRNVEAMRAKELAAKEKEANSKAR